MTEADKKMNLSRLSKVDRERVMACIADAMKLAPLQERVADLIRENQHLVKEARERDQQWSDACAERDALAAQVLELEEKKDPLVEQSTLEVDYGIAMDRLRSCESFLLACLDKANLNFDDAGRLLKRLQLPLGSEVKS